MNSIRLYIAPIPIETNHNLKDHMRMGEQLRSLGVRYDSARVAADERKTGAFKGVAEYVFRR